MTNDGTNSSPRLTSKQLDSVERVMRDRWGKENIVTSNEINKRCGYIDDGQSNPRIRWGARKLIEWRNMPVGSLSNGYFLIATDPEYTEVKEFLANRILSLHERLRALERAVEYVDQSRIEKYPSIVNAPQSRMDDFRV